MPSSIISSAPGITSAVRSPPDGATSGSSRRRGSPGRAGRAGATRRIGWATRRWRRAGWPRPPGRSSGRRPGRRARPARSASKCSGLPISSAALDRVGDVARSRSVGAGVSRTGSIVGRGLADIGVAGRRHDRRERGHPIGRGDGDGLGDHPAHRRADDVGPLDAQCVEQAEPVGGHVVEQVRRAGRVPAHGGHDHRRRRRRRRRPAPWWTARRRGCRSGSRRTRGRPGSGRTRRPTRSSGRRAP